MALEEQIRENADRYGVPIIREHSHIILEDIVKKLQPKHIIEIGTAVGYSAITMLKAAENSFVYTIEHDHEKVIKANENLKSAGVDKRCFVCESDCLAEIATMVANDKYNNYFDFCFLDGPKAQYLRLYQMLLPLMKKNGIIVADNVLFRGFVKDKSNMPRRFKTLVKRLNMFIDFVANDENVKSFEINEEDDGLMIIKLK